MLGRLMVCCEIGTGTSFVNVDGETGFVVPLGSPNNLANAINGLIGNEEFANKMGKSTQVRYERLFSGEAQRRVYAMLYCQVCERYKARWASR